MPDQSSTIIYTVKTEIERAYEDEWNEWQNEEHIPWNLSVPGYVSASRFIELNNRQKYMNLWQIESFSAYESPEHWIRSVTPWSRRLHRYRKLQVDFYIQANANENFYPGVGFRERPSCLVVDKIDFDESYESEIASWYDEDYIRQATEFQGVIGVRRLISIRGPKKQKHRNHEKHKCLIIHHLSGTNDDETSELMQIKFADCIARLPIRCLERTIYRHMGFYDSKKAAHSIPQLVKE